jgi:hypothetical protein
MLYAINDPDAPRWQDGPVLRDVREPGDLGRRLEGGWDRNGEDSMRRRGRLLLGTAFMAMILLPGTVRGQGSGGPSAVMDGAWHFTLAPYMWFSGIEGDVSAANLPPFPVEAPFSDIWSNFDFGLEGHFEARKDRVGLGVDFIWSDLGAVATAVELVDVKADVRQLITEGFVFYRLGTSGQGASLDVLVGARFTGTRARLTAQGAGGMQYDGEFQELSWVDAVGGVRFRAPLGSRFALLGRGDVAGFGSQLTWNVSGDLAFLLSEHWALGVGWRYMNIDYEEDEGLQRRTFDLAYSGPRFWFAYSW